MAVYVDDILVYDESQITEAARQYGREWCHLIADSNKELLSFARRLGLSASWMQRGGSGQWIHFDLTPGKRARAVMLGAQEISSHSMIEKLKAREANDAS